MCVRSRQQGSAFVLCAALSLVACQSRPSAAHSTEPAPSASQALSAPEPRAIAKKPSLDNSASGSKGPESARPAQPAPSVEVSIHTFQFQGPFGENPVVVVAPKSERPLPIVVALHGRGESKKPPARGARGFLDDYALERAIERLHQTPLGRSDYHGFVDAVRLERVNAALRERPFTGLVVVLPYLPDAFGGPRLFEDARPYGRFLVDEVLPRLRRDLPGRGTELSGEVSMTSLCGVSLGGRAALTVGSSFSASFGVIGAIQPALDESELASVADALARARRNNPRQRLWLMTSREDYFRGTTEALQAELEARGYFFDRSLAEGNHGYEFNRGPLVLEMLLHNDRVLRGYEPVL
jgi:hypothetical protein